MPLHSRSSDGVSGGGGMPAWQQQHPHPPCWRQTCPPLSLMKDEDGNETEQRMEFRNPPKPEGVNHGEADCGFNFPGSAGFIWQAMAVHSALLKGRKEMDDISHEETVMMMELCDELRESEHLKVEYQQDACKRRN